MLPPMPWFWIRNLTDDDLRAAYAYLNSIPPIRNAVPSPKIPEEVILATPSQLGSVCGRSAATGMGRQGRGDYR